MVHFLSLFITIFLSLNAIAFPSHWWNEVPAKELKSWEISPHTAKRGSEVVLSKRNELGVLSNFAHTPFRFEGKSYKSIEGFWQSLKYPESKSDIRYGLAQWPFTRKQVEKLIGSKAKKAGSFASKIMKENNINWVTYRSQKMTYRTPKKATHFHLIRSVMIEKYRQNQEVSEILLQTTPLKLLPDHKTQANDPPAWKYYEIWMQLRADLNKTNS